MKFDYILKTISQEKTPMSIHNFQFKIPHFQTKTIISCCLITISIKTCTFAIFNSAVTSNLMSVSPIVMTQSFILQTVGTLMVVDVNTS